MGYLKEQNAWIPTSRRRHKKTGMLNFERIQNDEEV